MPHSKKLRQFFQKLFIFKAAYSDISIICSKYHSHSPKKEPNDY
ncbi:hypothetical protein PRUB_a0517 [Pseudoalteromonas rubra]|uniref:Uncharacterized protein n=1 Tax=Pseudoalteromonas rubra TaxID=43658 RepID=A0A8T0C6Q4_9GAMM|nr:hypothetical protein PRUB_a0510 [Pseudoalteromonas rubra]KAF7786068.1 hypothetical protein PRUB_a0517 [Pseudoalteromonas rubra]